MSYIEKYTVSKRGQEVGPYTATEVIDLLRMKELSTIHKVKIGKDWVLISDFIDRFEKGDLPEQNLEKTFEDVEESVQESEPEAEVPVEEPEPQPEPEPEPIEVPQPGAATEIHVNRSGTQFGPYLFKELKDYLMAGNLRFSDMVWFDGVSEWVPLSRIPGVAEGIDSLGSAAPPPPKPPPAPAAPAAPPPMQQLAPSKPAEEAFEDQETELEEGDDSEASGDEEANPLSRGLASHGARLLAALVDGLIVLGVLGFLIGMVGFMTGDWDFLLLLSFYIGYFVLGWLYFGLTESSKSGGGVGKRMTKIKVVKASDGSTPGFALVSMRSLLKILFNLTLILPFVALLTPRRQGLHDLACGTIVRSEKEVDVEQDLTQ